MRRLFAEAFLVALTDDEHPEPALRYDEQRELNVTGDGRPFVEAGVIAAGTETLTEVRAEQDDFNRPDEEGAIAGLNTVTKVSREADDFAAPVMFGTETRQAPGERDDFARAERACGSETAIDGEADDFARADADLWAATRTSVPREADDFCDGSRVATPVSRRAAAA